VLLKNMAELELSPASVDLVSLSHTYWDHIGGLDSFLEEHPIAASPNKYH
jgi:metal-dependent hydrolase (beta-lactamase superfamily II)